MSQIASLEGIFATPIQAIIDADFMAARKATEYIKEFGFTSGGSKGKLGSLKETSFVYDTIGSDGKPQQRLVKIPTLSLIPLPLLHVDYADFDFSVRIVDSTNDKLNATLVPQQSGNPSNPSSPHLDANINVKMKVVQSDIPAGISNLLALMGSNTTDVLLDKIELEDPLLKFSDKKSVSTFLRLTDGNGTPIKNALIDVSYDEDNGIFLKHNHKLWEDGSSMFTDDNGEIHYHIAYDGEAKKTGAVYEIKFSHDKVTSVIQKIYME